MAQDITKGFMIYYDNRKHLSILSDEERGRLLMALLNYGETGQEPELDGAALMAFSFISSQIDRDAERYARICQRRREAGKKGGRPKAEGSEEEAKKADAVEGEGEKPREKEENQEETKISNGFEENQEKAKKPNGFEENQEETKKPINKNKNQNKNKNKNKNQNKNQNKKYTSSSSSNEEEKAPKGADAEEAVTPYKDIVNLYHEICQSYPKLKSVSSNRKKVMAARWKEYEGDLDAFRELFTKAEASSFLKGKSERGWTADFNWLMNSDNMAKVLEGKYDDKEHKGSFDTDRFFEAAVARSFAEKAENPPATAGTCSAIREKAERLRAMLC